MSAAFNANIDGRGPMAVFHLNLLYLNRCVTRHVNKWNPVSLTCGTCEEIML
jgi:hypothetical protein